MKPKRERKRFIQLIAIWLIIFQIATYLIGVTVATSETTDPDFDDPPISHLISDVLKILSVLENRIGDQQLLEKTKGKLFMLGEKQTRLIASLSDRVTQEGNTTGSEIAFLLMTALITLL